MADERTEERPEGEAAPEADRPDLSEDWNSVVESMLARVAEERKREPRLAGIARMMRAFLEERPEPPKSWFERLGDRASKFDYHQIQLPPNAPSELEEPEALRWLEENCTASFEALEHYLLTRNHFLFDDGHCKGEDYPCPMPLLMLETPAEDAEDGAEDRCFMLFADGSGYAWNLDDGEEEQLLQDATPLLRRHADVLSTLAWHPPVEGEDYGVL